MYNTEHLQEKWAPILDYDGMDPIRDSHRRSVTAILLENQERELREERSFLGESPTMSAGTGGFGVEPMEQQQLLVLLQVSIQF